MAPKPVEPPHRGEGPVGAEPVGTAANSGPRGGADAREREHTGPVAIERFVKDDGRALILYFDERRVEDPPLRA
jgi:hypothetical protein